MKPGPEAGRPTPLIARGLLAGASLAICPSPLAPRPVSLGTSERPSPRLNAAVARGQVSIRLLALYNLPSRRECRPKLAGGGHAAALAFVPELNGVRAPPEIGAAPMSPSLATSLHAIGGVCSVSPTNPPPEGAGTTYTTAAQIANGLNATFNELVHYVATEPVS